jgi:hypothetical protein
MHPLTDTLGYVYKVSYTPSLTYLSIYLFCRFVVVSRKNGLYDLEKPFLASTKCVDGLLTLARFVDAYPIGIFGV